MANLYAILGVNRNATPNEIKSAYRRLARKYHPDVNPDPTAASRFAQVSEAYHTLIDTERRNVYDRTGKTYSATAEEQQNSPSAKAARRAYYQARADRIVNEWLERERKETRARGKAVYTTVTLFISTFMVAMTKPSIFEITSPFWRIALVVLFAIGVWHLFTSLREHFDHYTYRPGRISITRSHKSSKPFKRSVAWAFVIGGYLLSLSTGMLIGMLTEDFSARYLDFGGNTMTDAFFAVLFYPPIAVLIVDTMYLINLRFEDL
ncbi:MAG TPA: DnaJ domain-containing protein [Blastocatellia bacterium]|nr:DnaJ domain-containing protein [Blastocatellia bacterium]